MGLAQRLARTWVWLFRVHRHIIGYMDYQQSAIKMRKIVPEQGSLGRLKRSFFVTLSSETRTINFGTVSLNNLDSLHRGVSKMSVLWKQCENPGYFLLAQFPYFSTKFPILCYPPVFSWRWERAIWHGSGWRWTGSGSVLEVLSYNSEYSRFYCNVGVGSNGFLVLVCHFQVF